MAVVGLAAIGGTWVLLGRREPGSRTSRLAISVLVGIALTVVVGFAVLVLAYYGVGSLGASDSRSTVALQSVDGGWLRTVTDTAGTPVRVEFWMSDGSGGLTKVTADPEDVEVVKVGRLGHPAVHVQGEDRLSVFTWPFPVWRSTSYTLDLPED